GVRGWSGTGVLGHARRTLPVRPACEGCQCRRDRELVVELPGEFVVPALDRGRRADVDVLALRRNLCPGCRFRGQVGPRDAEPGRRGGGCGACSTVEHVGAVIAAPTNERGQRYLGSEVLVEENPQHPEKVPGKSHLAVGQAVTA